MKKEKNNIYMDYAATTPVDPEVEKAMKPFFTEKFGNPASLHSFGREAKKALENSRKRIAEELNCTASEIIFTSSATESNNLALKGTAMARKKKKGEGGHILISSFEHDCVLNASSWLQKQGFKVERIPVGREGFVTPENVKKMIKEDTFLVSVMHANNEIGTIQPIRRIGKICREQGILFHTDAAQTFAKKEIDVKKDNIDLLTASSHKIYGPKGVGALFVREGVRIKPLLHGGGHEQGLRSSTPNVAGIVGFKKAVELCSGKREEENRRLKELRDKLIEGVLQKIPNSHLNGHQSKRLANNINFRFSFVEGEAIVLELDSRGIAGSTGSACASQELAPSHTLLALGLKPEQAHGSLRLSLGRWTKEEEIERVIEVLPEVIKKLRKISPFKNDLQ